MVQLLEVNTASLGGGLGHHLDPPPPLDHWEEPVDACLGSGGVLLPFTAPEGAHLGQEHGVASSEWDNAEKPIVNC